MPPLRLSSSVGICVGIVILLPLTMSSAHCGLGHIACATSVCSSFAVVRSTSARCAMSSHDRHRTSDAMVTPLMASRSTMRARCGCSTCASSDIDTRGVHVAAMRLSARSPDGGGRAGWCAINACVGCNSTSVGLGLGCRAVGTGAVGGFRFQFGRREAKKEEGEV